MSLRKFSRLERRSLLLVFFAVAGIQSLGEVWNIHERTSILYRDLEDHAALTATITARSVSTPLWQSDMLQVENAFTALRTDPDFVEATLLDNAGALRARLTAKGTTLSETFVTRVVPVIYAEVTPSERLGKLEIRFSPARIEQRVRMMILRAVLRSALVLAAISAALILIARQITRPLAKARDAIARIQQGDYHTAPIGTQRNDEIGEVMRAIDGFRLNAIEMEDLRRLNDRAARDERRRIRAALESTQDAAMIIRETGQVVFQNAPARIMLADLFTNLGPDLSLVENPADRQSIQGAILERKGLELNATVMIRLGPTSAKRKATPVRLRINPIYDSEESYLGVVILATDITDQVRAQSHINHLANHDSLTGLANRRVLEESLDAGLEDPDETDVALLLLDLDRFKIINDTLGHPVGDELLITVGNLLGTLCESGGIAARLGGDEFSMLFRGRSGIEAARRSASAIVEALSQTITVGDKTLRTGASIGIAHLRPGTDTASDGLRKADLALYEAKRRGRGRSVEFQQDLEHEIKRKTLLEKELRSALVNREIEAYFQRQVSLSTEELAGFEALARWHHADLGAISPEEFIAVAEETNQIAELTHQMLTQACRMAASWHKTGFRGRVSVNISPQLFAGALVEMIQDVLLSSNCPPEALELEITEAVLLENSRKNLDIVETIRTSGVHVALDDFGMGYSSLSYLQSFPVDRIKIDKAFVSRILESDETAAIVRAIVQLGHALGMSVTAEGVETEEQFAALHETGADCVQGFLHGRPVARDQTLLDIATWKAPSAKSA